MFGAKKTSITNQLNMKDELISQLDKRIYKLSKIKFDTEEENDRIFAIGKNLEKAKERLQDSVGGVDSDITIGVKKANDYLAELDNVLKGSFVGRIADATNDVTNCIDEIADYMEGITPTIEIDEDSEYAISNKLNKAYNSIIKTEEYLNKNKRNYMDNISRCQRDKEELEERMLKAQSQERIDSIYDEIMGVEQRIMMNSQQASLFSSNLTAITKIKDYFHILMNDAPLSRISVRKMSFISKIKELDYVLDNPDKVNRILAMISDEMKKTQGEIEKLKEGIKTTGLKTDSSKANAYLEKLKQKKMEENLVKGTADILNDEKAKDTEKI